MLEVVKSDGVGVGVRVGDGVMERLSEGDEGRKVGAVGDWTGEGRLGNHTQPYCGTGEEGAMCMIAGMRALWALAHLNLFIHCTHIDVCLIVSHAASVSIMISRSAAVLAPLTSAPPRTRPSHPRVPSSCERPWP
jgi:hypothetical protein